MTERAYPPRRFSVDRVAERLYEGSNLVEEVYRALGGEALPFYTMLADQPGTLREKLQEAARVYLLSLEYIFIEEGVSNSRGERLPIRPLDATWDAKAAGSEPIFTEHPAAKVEKRQ